MLDQLKKVFHHLTFLRPTDLIQLATIARVRSIRKGELFLQEGDLNYHVATVLKGLLRHFVREENGDEKTLRFVPEKKQTAMLETIFHNRMASENIEALEDSLLLLFDLREIDKLAASNIRLLKLQNQGYREVIAENVEHIKFLTTLSPEDRYTYFCSQYPSLEQRVKQKHLASYLGVTPTSLSRMRARMVQAKPS